MFLPLGGVVEVVVVVMRDDPDAPATVVVVRDNPAEVTAAKERGPVAETSCKSFAFFISLLMPSFGELAGLFFENIDDTHHFFESRFSLLLLLFTFWRVFFRLDELKTFKRMFLTNLLTF